MTDQSIERLFLDCSTRKLRQLAGRIEVCLAKLSDEQIWARGSENENAIGNLALHLCGNVRQWIGAGVGGHSDVRQRDGEFAAVGGVSAAELSERVRRTVEEAASIIETLEPARLTQRLLIQEYDVSVMEAIYHVVEHFSMHTGQIIFGTKMLTGKDLGFYAHLRSPARGHGQQTP